MHGKTIVRNGRKVPAMSRTSDLRGVRIIFGRDHMVIRGYGGGINANRGRGEDLIEKWMLKRRHHNSKKRVRGIG